MTNEQRNKIIDERIEKNSVMMFQMELDLISLRLVNDTEMIATIEESIHVLTQTNSELERMKVK